MTCGSSVLVVGGRIRHVRTSTAGSHPGWFTRYGSAGTTISSMIDVGASRAGGRPEGRLVDGAAEAVWFRGLPCGVPGRFVPSICFVDPVALALGVRNLCSEIGLPGARGADRRRGRGSDRRLRVEPRHPSTDGSRRWPRWLTSGCAVAAVTLRSCTSRRSLSRGWPTAVRDVDLVMAGPPCQGHSNLNNQTRRDDVRNALYLTVPAFAVAARARMAIVENVPEVTSDRSRVVETARRLFESAGYSVAEGILSADAMGWPQTRRRHFLVARIDAAPIPIRRVSDVLADASPRSVWWAIGDLEARSGDDPMDRAAALSPENRQRVDWLFDNDEYDLPCSERPECHRESTSYPSVYSRMRRDTPAQTITTGFMTPGRGRYVHPTQRRTLTPREAARLQGFPDSYRFVTDPRHPPTRAKLAKWIGDAVPMPLGYGAALSAIGGDVSPFLR